MTTSDESISTEPLERELEVVNALGLHARAAARIAALVRAYRCRVWLAKDGQEADGASVLSILTLDAPKGSILTARVEGPQADQVLVALKDLFDQRFGEDR